MTATGEVADTRGHFELMTGPCGRWFERSYDLASGVRAPATSGVRTAAM